MKKVYCFSMCLWLLVLAPRGYCQRHSNNYGEIPKCYWLATGGGISSLGNLSLGIDLNAELANRWLLSAGATGESSALLDFSNTHQTDVSVVGLSAGKILKQESSFITLTAGLGYMNIHNSYFTPGSLAQQYRDTYRNTIGIPISVTGYLVALQALGIGLSGYINLNTIQTTAGIHLKFAFGRLATH